MDGYLNTKLVYSNDRFLLTTLIYLKNEKLNTSPIKKI